jgi:RimJ/RimL family protein N-acetyltransferase
MTHDVHLEKFGVRLRPVRLEDAGFIVSLRNSPHVLPFVGDSAADVAGQEAWLQRYFERPNDWYFLVEIAAGSQVVGTIGLYDVDGKTGEWGRWITLPGIGAAPASAWLVLHFAFEVLKLEAALGHVVESNAKVLSLHERMGNPRIGFSDAPRVIGGQAVRMVAYRAARADWPRISARLDRYARMAEAQFEKQAP